MTDETRRPRTVAKSAGILTWGVALLFGSGLLFGIGAAAAAPFLTVLGALAALGAIGCTTVGVYSLADNVDRIAESVAARDSSATR